MATSTKVGDLATVKKRIGEVLQQVNRYWAGEAEVASTYFTQPHTKEDHLRWLKSQMVRELGWPDGRLTRIVDAFAKIERDVSRDSVWAMIRNTEEEFSHYVVLADIAEELAGERIVPEDLMYNKDMTEWKGLDQVRTREADWDTAVSGFHEGGGLGIYQACMVLDPDPADPAIEKIASAMAMIYDDELSHAANGFKNVVRIAASVTDEEWQQVLHKADAVGYHRVRMRNEQFGFPLSEERVQEIQEGKIAPYIPPLPETAEVYAKVVGAAS